MNSPNLKLVFDKSFLMSNRRKIGFSKSRRENLLFQDNGAHAMGFNETKRGPIFSVEYEASFSTKFKAQNSPWKMHTHTHTRQSCVRN